MACAADLTPFPDSDADASGASVAGQIREASILMVNSNYAGASHLLEGTVRDHPEVLEAWERLGWCYWHQGRTKDAIALWELLAAVDPRQPLPLNLLAKAATIHDDTAAAIGYYERSLQLKPDQPEVRWRYARALRWAGRREESRRALEALHTEYPNRDDFTLAAARALLEDQQYADALPLWTALKTRTSGIVEYQAGEVRCLIATGQMKPTLADVRGKLSADPNHPLCLEILADVAEYSEHPEEALPFLRKLMEIQTDPTARERIRMRIVRLIIRLHQSAPLKFSVEEAIQLLQERLKTDPGSVESMLLLGELHLTAQRPAEARKQFLDVLQRVCASNVRAHLGLFEADVALRDYVAARKQLDFLAQFDPYDPYLNYYLARLEAARGDFYHAYRALDRLEAAGQRGAVAVLLYHALSPDSCPHSAVSVARFDEHIQALRDAKIAIVTPAQMAAAFKDAGTAPRTAQPAMSVMVTFDDVRRDAMEFGTPIAKKHGVTFVQHIPVAPIMEGNPFHCSWDEMAAYAKTGCWVFGSHCLYAHDLPQINREGRRGSALANYKWNPAAGSMETPREFAARLHAEFAESRKQIQQHLGDQGQPAIVAYPYGDIGQEGYSSVEGAVPAVLAAAAKDYTMGWIQTSFGFAVNGDNPLLYQRFDVDRFMTGTQLVAQIYEHHPMYLARRLRAEVAALDDKLYRARETIGLLERTGFPVVPLRTTRTYVENRLARKSIAPVGTEVVAKGPFHIELQKPYLGVHAEGERDNQDRESWQLLGLAGIKLTPNISVEGAGGVGSMSQTVDLRGPNGRKRIDLDVDERDLGLSSVLNLPNGFYLAGQALRRDFQDPANRDYWRYVAESQVRPIAALDLTLRFEHDVAPSALAATSNITYDAWLFTGVGRLRDWWDVTVDGGQYRFSDDNTRTEFGLATSLTLHERSGFFVGARYAYTSAEEEREDAYWTPYHLHRMLAEAGFRGSYLHTYYRLVLGAGIGREDVRPEVQAAYDEAVALSRTQHFDPGSPPESEWEPVYHATAACNVPLDQHWSLRGEISYGHVPDYSELRGIAGAYLKF